MEKQKRLLFARNIFAFIIFVLFGVIIVTESGKGLLVPKVEKEITKYLDTHYKELKKDIIQEKTTYKAGIYKTKIVSKENKHLYFYITKENKKIKDTYQKDYIEGNTLFTYLNKKIENEIKEKTNTNITVTIVSTLDQHIPTIQERIIKEEDLLTLKFYTIKKELLIADWSSKEITNRIIDTIELYNEKEITPKNYTLIITNKKHMKESIEIKNLTTDFLKNTSNKEIINDILNNKETRLLKENDITYKYLEEE